MNSFTDWLVSVPNSIMKIFGSGAPSKICEAVILMLAVFMQALHPRRAWPDESFEDKRMNRPGISPSDGN